MKYIIILSLCVVNLMANAQEKRVLTFDEYLNNVKDANIGYLVEKYNIDIAEANVKAAGMFPSPEMSVSYANNQNWNRQMGYGVDAGWSYTLELGGKRRARIRLAQSEKEVTSALLDDYFRNLRADATLAYLAALKQRKLCEIQKSSYQQMLLIARADSIRFQSGAIPEIDARQSKLEAATLLNEVYSSEGDLRDILAQLSFFQGNDQMELPDSIAGELFYMKREFDLSALTAMAQNNRADLQAALKYREVSQNNLRLARANRAIDLGITLGGNYSSEVLNEIAPAPAFTGVTAGINIPLKFFNTNKGELRAAQLETMRSEMQYRTVEMQIASEVAQAYNRYTTACRQAEQFNTGMLNDAKAILQKKTYSYECGETSILEVLDAQRTCNDIQISYYETLYNCIAALIELERACGVLRFEI